MALSNKAEGLRQRPSNSHIDKATAQPKGKKPKDKRANGADGSVLRFNCFTANSHEVASALQSARKGFRKYPSGTTFLYEGDIMNEVFTLFTGWAFGYKLLEDGRRQILNIYLPGDALGLSAFSGTFIDHDVESVGSVQLCVFDAARMRLACRQNSVLLDQIIRLIDIERLKLQQRLIGVGRRSSPENIAHFLLTLFMGLKSRDLTYGNACTMPLTQTVMADALGLSAEHLNRLLHQLRDDGLVSVSRGKMVIHDPAAFAKMAGIDDPETLSQPLL